MCYAFIYNKETRPNMGRTSTKENKNSYQLAREELGLTREKASELLETIAPERIEKIENERTVPRPDEVLTMAEKYKRPSLCNCYCSQQCPIGQRYVPFVTRRELPAIILEMLASLNAMNSKKERLIEIAADGKISNDEIDDFIHIRQELERISLTVETLQLWTERMLANGQIDAEHRKLVDLVNELHTATSQGNGQSVVADLLERLIADAKPMTRHLTGLAISMETRGPLYLGAACYLGDELTIYPYSPEAIEISGQQWHGGILHTIDTMTIQPQPTGGAA